MNLIPINPLNEIIWAAGFFLWIMILVSWITKKTYEVMTGRGIGNMVAIYYNRKLIHVAAGALVAIFVPFIFSSPFIPAVLAFILAISTYLPHRTGKLMYWFQVEENLFEVHFCIMWGIMITVPWLITESPWYGVLINLFMAVGDGVTGVVRNMIYKKRTKSWWGNLAMAIFCIPFGYWIASTYLGISGYWGALAGLIASIIEHFEYGQLDDNVTIPFSSFIILMIPQFL